MKITFEFLNFEQAESFMVYAREYYSSNPEDHSEKVAENTPENKEPKTAHSATDAGDPKDGEPKTRRRRSKKEEPATTGRRSRRSSKDEDKEISSSEDKEISDADASKAASEAAKELSVQVVLEELHAHKVDKVSELDQPQRKSFMNRLRDLLNPDKEKGTEEAW